MGAPAIIIATCCYLVTAYDCLKQKDYAHSLTWTAYAVANLGLLWHFVQNQEK